MPGTIAIAVVDLSIFSVPRRFAGEERVSTETCAELRDAPRDFQAASSDIPILRRAAASHMKIGIIGADGIGSTRRGVFENSAGILRRTSCSARVAI
jgi:hypothetical protein